MLSFWRQKELEMTVAEPKSDPDSDNEVKRICGAASEKEESEKIKQIRQN